MLNDLEAVRDWAEHIVAQVTATGVLARRIPPLTHGLEAAQDQGDTSLADGRRIPRLALGNPR